MAKKKPQRCCQHFLLKSWCVTLRKAFFLYAYNWAIQPESLSLRFHKTEISKRYVCLVHGRVSQAKGLVDANIRTLRTDATTRREEM